MIRCKIRKHTKAVAVLILCVAVCIILMAAFGGERKIPFFGTWRIEREVIIPELTPELTSGMPLEEAMFVTTDFIGYELEYTGEYYREGEPTSRYPYNPVLQERTAEDPHYAIKYITLSEFNHWGILQPYLEQLIEEEVIKINNMEDYDEEETLLLQVRHRLWGHEELEKKCTLLNDDMMLIEDRGRIFFARREGWMS